MGISILSSFIALGKWTILHNKALYPRNKKWSILITEKQVFVTEEYKDLLLYPPRLSQGSQHECDYKWSQDSMESEEGWKGKQENLKAGA